MGEGVDQVVNLISGQRQAELGVGRQQRGFAATQHIHMGHGGGGQFLKELGGLGAVKQHAFGHAVVQQVGDLQQLRRAQRGLGKQPALERQAVFDDALDAFDGQTAVVRNVTGLGSPG